MTYIIKLGNPMRDRVFSRTEDIEKLLTLRKNGVAVSILADMFKVDRATIYHHLKKHGLAGVTRVKGETHLNTLTKAKNTVVPHLDEYGSPVCEGHDYKIYAEKDKKEREAEHDKYLPQRIAEENRKNRFCEDIKDVLIRQRW